MASLDTYTRTVKLLESRIGQADVARRATAIQSVIDAIRAERWLNGDERGEAQVLVYRLERLRHPGQLVADSTARSCERPRTDRQVGCGIRPSD